MNGITNESLWISESLRTSRQYEWVVTNEFMMMNEFVITKESSWMRLEMRHYECVSHYEGVVSMNESSFVENKSLYETIYRVS